MKNVIIIGRFVIYFLFFFQPFLTFISRHFKIFDFAMLVYPGAKGDITNYIFFEKARKFVPPISIIGFIRGEKSKSRGVVIASKYTIEEMSKGRAQEVFKSVIEFTKSTAIKKVALTGRLPGLFKQTYDSLFVKGEKGTIFAILENIRGIIERKKLSYSNIRVGVLGIGFIGRELLNCLSFYRIPVVVGVDPRFKELKVEIRPEVTIKTGDNPSLLSECDLIIILTPQGDDVKEVIPYLKKGVIIFDDTHPPISKNNISHLQSKSEIYKIALGWKGMRFFPPLPNWDSKWLPGCVMETLVILRSERKWSNQCEFNQIATQMGFKALLIQLKS